MHSLVIALNRLRAPFSIALATALVLALPSQSREILGAVWAGSGLPLVAEAGRALVALLIFAATLLGCALILLQTAPEYREAAVKRHWRLLEAVALGVALIPILIVVLVTIAVLFLSPEPTERPTWVGRREIPVAIAFALFAGCVALLWYLDKFRTMLATRFLRLYSSLAGLTLTQGLLIVGFIIVGVSAIIFFYPKQFASAFGPICVLFLFLGLVCIATSLLTLRPLSDSLRDDTHGHCNPMVAPRHQ